MSDQQHDWAEIGRRLREPFNPDSVEFRVQGKANQNGKAQVVAYVDARCVQDRLDDVVGPGAWSFDWSPLVVEKGDVQVAKGTVSIHGVAKSDAGTASNFEQSLGAVSHCFKRAAVQWGIGRYLYDLPTQWVPVNERGFIADHVLAELRRRLPAPVNYQPASQPASPPHRESPPQPQQQQRPAASAPSDVKPATQQQQGKPAAAFLGWNGLADVEFRKRCNALGVKTAEEVDRLLRRALEWGATNRESAFDYLDTVLVPKAPAPQSPQSEPSLEEAFTGGVRP